MQKGRSCNYKILNTLLLASSPFVFISSASAAPVLKSNIIEFAPLVIIIGSLIFGVIGSFFVRSIIVEKKANEKEANEQLSSMRSTLDNYEVLLAGLPQIIIIFSQENSPPVVHGQSDIVFPPYSQLENVINFTNWLSVKDSEVLNSLVIDLKKNANRFEISLKGENGHDLRISGHVLGGRAALRIRRENLLLTNDDKSAQNPIKEENQDQKLPSLSSPMPSVQDNLIDENNDKSFEYIKAITTPIVICNNEQKIIHFNKAFTDLWELQDSWLEAGPSEKAFLNHLHTKRMLPSASNYRKWRDDRLASYDLDKRREEEWFLPNGRTLKVVASPIKPSKGVIYIYEDITERRALKTRHNALIKVQSETINSLSEGVAVFGTNGRLTLYNSPLSLMWKLPMNELAQQPHIDKIAKICAKAMPQDGETIWNSLKSVIFDLDSIRKDKSERLKLADGRLIEHSITRLPDAQTMITFIDVTQSASYETMLKERNDALVIADNLKDQFVQNISYELRTPLTDIIGFTDMLALKETGPLNEKQHSYANYIRTSSQTLAVLIDNILDLAHADAGILQLEFEKQDMNALVERAKAGIVGMLNSNLGEMPVNLEINIEKNLPDFYADGTRIVQILYNLLSNAVRFSDKGSKICLDITSLNKRIIFTIKDEGIGISQEMKDALFSRFEGEGEKGRQRGAGLGLAIVKTFVSLHQGTILLESREPKGTKVVVSIPIGLEKTLSL